jgi:hypothetical protein
MRVMLESTTKIVDLIVDGRAIPARIWEGATETGIACHAYVTRIAVNEQDNAAEFERELQEQRVPENPDVRAIPLHLVL